MTPNYSKNRCFSSVKRLAVWTAYRSGWLTSYSRETIEKYLYEAAEYSRITRKRRINAIRQALTANVGTEDLKRWLLDPRPAKKPGLDPGTKLAHAHGIEHNLAGQA
jgi:hypothetical protein